MLVIKSSLQICNVLSVGFSKEMIPMITVTEETEAKCYRIPTELTEWAMTLVGFANLGENLFPSKIVFSKTEEGYFADIL